MKKIYFVFLFLLSLVVFTKVDTVNAYDGITKTGHSDIVELDFYNQDAKHYLLNQMSDSLVKSGYDKIKRKFFGWSTYLYNNEVPVWYISKVIFSKSNKTSSVVCYEYDLTYSTTNTHEVSYSGTIATKLGGKIDSNFTLNLDSTRKLEYSYTFKDYYEEATNFKVVVPVNRKVSLIIKGDADLYTGVGKYYILGIPFSKGTFEYIDKLTESYELYEEDA